MSKDEMKDRISMALKDPILQQGFELICKNLAELKEENKLLQLKLDALDGLIPWKDIKDKSELIKENAELKEKCAKLEQGYVWHDYDAGEDSYEDSHEGRWVKRDEVEKLDKAKEILKGIVQTPMYYQMGGEMYESEEYKELIVESEQFLKEADK